MYKQHHIQFPCQNMCDLDQDEAFFYLMEGNHTRKIRFHDYHEIYKVPGLYEQLFQERLKCRSPNKMTAILHSSVAQTEDNMTQLRVLDLGAGNGLMGEVLKKHGVSRLVGVDIIPEAHEATVRDRAGIYDTYYVMDLCALSREQKETMAAWSFDCMTAVGALGFNDIPPKAFIEGFNIIKNGGWIAFNIKESFLDRSDDTGFSETIRALIFSESFSLYHLERYRHRFSIEGVPLYYFAVVGLKNFDIPEDLTSSIGVPSHDILQRKKQR